jgi:hypothetical protein
MPTVHIMTPTRWLVLLTFVGAFVVALSLSLALADEPGSGPVPDWVEAEQPVSIAPVPDKTEDPVSAMTEFYRAIKGGDYWYAVGLCLALLTFGFRKLLAGPDGPGEIRRYGCVDAARRGGGSDR